MPAVFAEPARWHGGAVEIDVAPALTDELTAQIVDCWVRVVNAGGAVGFVAPVRSEEVADRVASTFRNLGPDGDRLIIGRDAGRLVGWVLVRRHGGPQSHVGTVSLLQVRPDAQGCGHGGALLEAAGRIAREAMGLEMLQLAVRGRTGTERFYVRYGYREWGRLAGAVRVSAGDDRDLIWMARRLR